MEKLLKIIIALGYGVMLFGFLVSLIISVGRIIAILNGF